MYEYIIQGNYFDHQKLPLSVQILKLDGLQRWSSFLTVFDRERNRAFNLSRAVPGPNDQHTDTFSLIMAVFQITKPIQIFNPYFVYSNAWRTSPAKHFSKEQFKIKRIKDGAITFWLHKHKDPSGSRIKKETTAPLTDLINLAAPLNLSGPTCVRHPASHPSVSNGLQWLFASTGPNAPAKLVS